MFESFLPSVSRIVEGVRNSLKFSAAIAAGGAGPWNCDLATRRFATSPRWRTLLGYAESEGPSDFDQFLEVVHAEDRDRVSEALTAIVEDKNQRKLEYLSLIHI